MLDHISKQFRNTISPLMGEIVEDTETLVRQEVALALSEFRRELAKAKASVVSLGISIGIALISFGILSLTFVHLLASTYPSVEVWKWYATVSVFDIAIAGFLFARSQKLKNEISFLPKETIESMKENAQWVKDKF